LSSKTTRFEKMLEAVPDGSTLEGVITSWNPAAERLYGYSSKGIIGRSDSLLNPEDRAGEVNDVLARVKDGEAVEGLETVRVRKDGTVVPVSITMAPIREEDGAIVGACAVHRDVRSSHRHLVRQRVSQIHRQ
jgi:PAS domain S-box-containing protein